MPDLLDAPPDSTAWEPVDASTSSKGLSNGSTPPPRQYQPNNAVLPSSTATSSNAVDVDPPPLNSTAWEPVALTDEYRQPTKHAPLRTIDDAIREEKKAWESSTSVAMDSAQRDLVNPWKTHWDLAHRYDLHSGAPGPNTAVNPNQPEPLTEAEKQTLYQQYRKANAALSSATGSKAAASQLDPSVAADAQRNMNPAQAALGEAQTAFEKSPLGRGVREMAGVAAGGDIQEIHRNEAMRPGMSEAATKAHPVAAPVGQQVGFMARPEVAMLTAATGGLAAGAGQGATLAGRTVLNAAAAGTSMGGVQTADQAMAGQPLTPVENFAVNAAAGGVGTAGAALVGKAITPAFAAASPGKAAALKFLGGIGIAGGTQAGVGASAGQTSTQEIIANIMAGAAGHVAGSGVETLQEIQAARETLAKAPANPEVDAAIARLTRYEAALGKRDDQQGRAIATGIRS